MSVISVFSSDEDDECFIVDSSEEDADLEQTHTVFIVTDADGKLSHTAEGQTTEDPLGDVDREDPTRSVSECSNSTVNLSEILSENLVSLSSNDTWNNNAYEQHDSNNNQEQAASSVRLDFNEIENNDRSKNYCSEPKNVGTLPTKFQFLAKKLAEVLRKNGEVSTETYKSSCLSGQKSCHVELENGKLPAKKLSSLEYVIHQVSKADFQIYDYHIKNRSKSVLNTEAENSINLDANIKDKLEGIAMRLDERNTQLFEQTPKQKKRGRKIGWRKNPKPTDSVVGLHEPSETKVNETERKKPGRKKGWRKKLQQINNCDLDLHEITVPECHVTKKVLGDLDNNDIQQECNNQPNDQELETNLLACSKLSKLKKNFDSGIISIFSSNLLCDKSVLDSTLESNSNAPSPTYVSNTNEVGPPYEKQQVQPITSLVGEKVNNTSSQELTSSLNSEPVVINEYITEQPSNSTLTLEDMERLKNNFVQSYKIIFTDVCEYRSMKMGDLLLLALKEVRNLKSRIETAEKFTCENLKAKEVDLALKSYKTTIEEYRIAFRKLFFDFYTKIFTDQTILKIYNDQCKCMIIALFLKAFMRVTILAPEFSDCLLEARDIIVNLLFSSPIRELPLIRDVFLSNSEKFERNCFVVLGFLQGCINTSGDQETEECQSDIENLGTPIINAKDVTDDTTINEKSEHWSTAAEEDERVITIVSNTGYNSTRHDGTNAGINVVSKLKDHPASHMPNVIRHNKSLDLNKIVSSAIDEHYNQPKTSQESQSNTKCIFHPVIQSNCNKVPGHLENTSTLAANTPEEEQSRQVSVEFQQNNRMRPDNNILSNALLKRKANDYKVTSCSKFQKVDSQPTQTCNYGSLERGTCIQPNNFRSFHQNVPGPLEMGYNTSGLNGGNTLHKSAFKDINTAGFRDVNTSREVGNPKYTSPYSSQPLQQQNVSNNNSFRFHSPYQENIHQPPYGPQSNVQNNYAINHRPFWNQRPYTTENQPTSVNRTDKPNRAAEGVFRHHPQYSQNAQKPNIPSQNQMRFYNNAYWNAYRQPNFRSGPQQYYPPKSASGTGSQLSIQIPTRTPHNAQTVNNYNINAYMAPPPPYEYYINQKRLLELHHQRLRIENAQVVPDVIPKETLHYYSPLDFSKKNVQKASINDMHQSSSSALLQPEKL